MPRGVPKSAATAPQETPETPPATAEALPTPTEVLAGTAAQDRQEVEKLLERLAEAESALSECQAAYTASEETRNDLLDQVARLSAAPTISADAGLDRPVKEVIDSLREYDRRGSLGHLRQAESDLRRLIVSTSRR